MAITFISYNQFSLLLLFEEIPVFLSPSNAAVQSTDAANLAGVSSEQLGVRAGTSSNRLDTDRQ